MIPIVQVIEIRELSSPTYLDHVVGIGSVRVRYTTAQVSFRYIKPAYNYIALEADARSSAAAAPGSASPIVGARTIALDTTYQNSQTLGQAEVPLLIFILILK